MAKLEVTLLQEFGHGVESKGIIFSKTRKSTRCLNDWILSNAALQAAGVRADAIIGAGGGLGSMSQVCSCTELSALLSTPTTVPPPHPPLPHQHIWRQKHNLGG